MGLIANDTFTGANGTLLQNHVSDSGHSWVKRSHLGATNFTIQNNQCVFSSGLTTDADGYHIEIEPTEDAYEMEASGKIAQADSSNKRLKIMVRADPNPDNRNAYTLILYSLGANGIDSQMAIWKLLNGVGTDILANVYVPKINADEFHTLKFRTRINGSGNVELEGYLDGVLYAAGTDSEADKITWRGRAGIGGRREISNNTITWDNFVLRSLVADVESAEHAHEALAAQPGEIAAADTEHAQEVTSAAATIAPAIAEHQHEADEVEAQTAGLIHTAEHLHEVDEAPVTASVADAEHAQEADAAPAKTVQDAEHVHEAEVVPVTAAVAPSEHVHEADEVQKRTEVDSSEHFHEATQAHPVVEAGIKISVDRPQPIAARYSFGVAEREQNIVQGSLGAVELPEQERLVRRLTAHYRYDSRARDFLQKDLAMDANEFGVEQDVPMNYVGSHETAARVLDYLRKDEIARASRIEFSGKKIVKAARNQRYAVRVPSIGLDSEWQVADYRTLQEAYAFRMKRYLEIKYTYEPPEELPADESLPELTVFGDTPPFPVSNFQVSTSYEVKPDGSVETYVVATWSPPEENYSEARVSIRKTGETDWNAAGKGFDRAQISGFVPGTSYDVMVTPFNLAGTSAGIASIATAVIAGADQTNPTTPTGLAGSSKHGLVSFTWNRHTDPNVQGYHIRFWTASSGGAMIVPPGMKFVRQPEDADAEPQFEFQRQKGNLTTALQTWAEVRAVKYNGRLSSYTSRQSATTSDVDTGDIRDGGVTNAKLGAISASKITLSGTLICTSAGTAINVTSSGVVLFSAGGDIIMKATATNTNFIHFQNQAGADRGIIQYLPSTNAFMVASSGAKLQLFASSGDAELLASAAIKLTCLGSGATLTMSAAGNITLDPASTGVIVCGDDTRPGTNNAYSLGSSPFKWAHMWTVVDHVGDVVYDNGYTMTEADKVFPWMRPEDGMFLMNTRGKILAFFDEKGNMDCAGRVREKVGFPVSLEYDRDILMAPVYF